MAFSEQSSLFFIYVMSEETHRADDKVSLQPLAIIKAYGGLLADMRFVAPAGAIGLLWAPCLRGILYRSPRVLIDGLGLSPIQLGLFCRHRVRGIRFRHDGAAPRDQDPVCRPRPLAATTFAAIGGARY